MRRPGRRRLAFLTAALLFLTAVPVAKAEPQRLSLAYLHGTEWFRRVLFDAGKDAFPEGVQPLHDFNELNDPRHTILLVLGDANRLTEVPGGLRNFVDQGGVLFVATDRRPSAPASAALAEVAGVNVSGRAMVCDNHDDCYHGLPYCPYLMPFGRTDLFRNIEEVHSIYRAVAANAPSFLVRAAEEDGGPTLPKLAALPIRSHAEDDANPALLALLAAPLFAVGGNVGDGDGRVLVMADHSIFINEMMLQRDNGNVEFSYNCLQWMIGDKDDRRTKILFVEDGRINIRFEVPLKEIPDEAIDKALDAALQHLPEVVEQTAPQWEAQLQQFDRRGGADDLLLRSLSHVGITPDGLLRGLAVALAVVVVLVGCWKVGWKANHSTDMQGPLLSFALYRLAPAGTLSEQRHKALLHGDNLWEPARDLARQFLTGAGVSAGAAPPVEVRGGWLRRWAMTGRVKRLWRLAYGRPARVSLSEWRRLLRDVKRLKDGLGDGTVRFS